MRLNLPLWLTFGRVAVIPVVLALFYVPWEHARQAATVLFALAGFTDWLDGYLARRWNQTSKFGAFLDPVADKLLVAVCLIMLMHEHPGPGSVMAVIVAIIIGREITVSALREWMAELGQRTSVAVTSIGKLKTGSQMVAIGMMIWRDDVLRLPIYWMGFGLLVAAAALTVWSMVMYLRAAWPLMKEAG